MALAPRDHLEQKVPDVIQALRWTHVVLHRGPQNLEGLDDVQVREVITTADQGADGRSYDLTYMPGDRADVQPRPHVRCI